MTEKNEENINKSRLPQYIERITPRHDSVNFSMNKYDEIPAVTPRPKIVIKQKSVENKSRVLKQMLKAAYSRF